MRNHSSTSDPILVPIIIFMKQLASLSEIILEYCLNLFNVTADGPKRRIALQPSLTINQNIIQQTSITCYKEVPTKNPGVIPPWTLML